jgi:uncharacterized protein YcfL
MRSVVLALLLAACGSHKEGPPPNPETALQVGVAAPAVTLTRPSGTQVALADLTKDHDKTIVVFYRGFF